MSYADPARAPKPDPTDIPQEPTGAVASDSLAAESNRAGGGFSENENIAQLSVKGASSTLANTDTSGATALHAAVDGAERERQDAKGLGSDERGVTGVRYPDADAPQEFSGTTTREGYTGGPAGDLSTSGGGSDAPAFSGASGDSFADGGAGLTGSSSGGKDPKITSGSAVPSQGRGVGTDTGSSTNTSTSASGQASSGSGGGSGPDAGTGAAPYVETAPTYAATVSGSIRSEGELQPKGKNLVEGDIPETKTFTGNVGGDKDPGRLAEQEFEKINADTAGEVKYGGKGSGDSSNPFGALESERA